jgi:hypothetical protein
MTREEAQKRKLLKDKTESDQLDVSVLSTLALPEGI